ncbi:MAG: OmpA family protein [Pseudomonadota bacterium]
MRTFLAALALTLAAGAASANPCGFPEAVRLVVKGYPIGGTAVPAEQRERLSKFAETAKDRFEICVFAQVDKTGSDAANQRVAEGRAQGVVNYLVNQGVPARYIEVAKQEEALTFFGLLPDNQDDDRRVVVTHD